MASDSGQASEQFARLLVTEHLAFSHLSYGLSKQLQQRHEQR